MAVLEAQALDTRERKITSGASDRAAESGPYPRHARLCPFWRRAARRVEIARSLCIQPNFILLDEPFSGIDPIAVPELQKIIFDLNQVESAF